MEPNLLRLAPASLGTIIQLRSTELTAGDASWLAIAGPEAGKGS